MNGIRQCAIGLAVLSCLMLTTLHAVDNSEKVKIKGLITSRTGDTLIVKTADSSVTVVLTDDTKAQKPKGLGLRKTQMSFAALIPGLKVSVEGVYDEKGQLVANVINFSGEDLKTAEAIQAGVAPTQQAVEANKQDVSKRFEELTEYDIKGQTTVYFASGSKTISDDGQNSLRELARNAGSLTGYLIEVKGYADSSGNAAMNQKLSMERAEEVVAFLIQNCNVPVRRVVAPGAMGTAAPAATNETAQGRSQNRRVEVKVLMNRGLAGGTSGQ